MKKEKNQKNFLSTKKRRTMRRTQTKRKRMTTERLNPTKSFERVNVNCFSLTVPEWSVTTTPHQHSLQQCLQATQHNIFHFSISQNHTTDAHAHERRQESRHVRSRARIPKNKNSFFQVSRSAQ